jgi:segregation and condensation protein A
VSYRVRIESFEGPFDLLLYLVSRKKVDIGGISINEITEQYLAEISRMEDLDLDVASDFLLVASTLLELKAASLIPKPPSDVEEEFPQIAPSEVRDILVERLLTYKQYKSASQSLYRRYISEGRIHIRPFGPDVSLLTLMPDYLEGVRLDDIAMLCAAALGRREQFLLDSDHIAVKPIPVESFVSSIYDQLHHAKRLHFSDLVDANARKPIIVVNFLAVLELFKRGMIDVEQDQRFGDIALSYIEGSGDLLLDKETPITSVDEENQ